MLSVIRTYALATYSFERCACRVASTRRSGHLKARNEQAQNRLQVVIESLAQDPGGEAKPVEVLSTSGRWGVHDHFAFACTGPCARLCYLYKCNKAEACKLISRKEYRRLCTLFVMFPSRNPSSSDTPNQAQSCIDPVRCPNLISHDINIVLLKHVLQGSYYS